MARPARPWFRLYTECFHDRKLLRLTPAQRWVWVAVLGAARESCDPGRLLVAADEPMTVGELAHYADVPVDDVSVALEVMRRLGMVDWDDQGVITVRNWQERQFESDNTAVRTAKRRSQERRNDSGGNGSDTETDTETELESAHTKTSYPQRRGKTAIPDPWTVTDEMVAWVLERYPRLDWSRETERFVSWAKANDRRYADWVQAWRNWMHRAGDTTKGGRW